MDFFENAISLLVKIINTFNNDNIHRGNADTAPASAGAVLDRVNISQFLMSVNSIRPPPFSCNIFLRLGSIPALHSRLLSDQQEAAVLVSGL